MTSAKNSNWRNIIPLAGVWGIFIVSRILYDRAGIQFEGDIYQGAWHFIDPHLMLTDLWRSVYYLHSQPPLLNLTIGVIFQAFPNDYQEVFHILYYGIGLLFASGIYFLAIQLRLPHWLSAVLTAWFMISPAAIFYEHLLAYGYPIVALLTWSAVFLHRFAETRRTRWGAPFFFCLAAIALLWGFFHIVWVLGSLLATLVLIPERKKVILAAFLPFLIVAGWYAKNFFQVGQFTASTWAGMNLSKIATFRTPEKERKVLVKSGKLSELALIPPFRNPQVYLKFLPETPLTGIPILDEPETLQHTRNHHHLVYAEASQIYLRDALRVIFSMPEYYLRSIVQAVYIYFHAASDFDPVIGNRNRVWEFDLWWNRVFHGQWQGDETSIDRNSAMSAEHVGWWIVAGFFFVTVGCAQFLWKNRRRLAEPQNLLVLFLLYNILFVTLVGNTLDIGENNRFRYVIDPFLLLFPVFLLRLKHPRTNTGDGKPR